MTCVFGDYIKLRASLRGQYLQHINMSADGTFLTFVTSHAENGLPETKGFSVNDVDSVTIESIINPEYGTNHKVEKVHLDFDGKCTTTLQLVMEADANGGHEIIMIRLTSSQNAKAPTLQPLSITDFPEKALYVRNVSKTYEASA